MQKKSESTEPALVKNALISNFPHFVALFEYHIFL